MSSHSLRTKTKNGQEVMIECGWDSWEQHYTLSIEDDRFVTCYNTHDNPADWPKDLVMFDSRDTKGGKMTLTQIEEKFTELGITVPPALLVHLKIEQEQNLDRYRRFWSTGLISNHEKGYQYRLWSDEVDPRLINPSSPQKIILRSTDDLSDMHIRQQLVEMNITYGHTFEIGGTAIIGPNVTLGDEVLFQGNVTVGARSHIETGVILNEGCVVGEGVCIGEWAEISDGVQIEDRVQIGKDCLLRRHAYIEQDAQIGAGARIGKNQRVTSHTIIAAGSGWNNATE